MLTVRLLGEFDVQLNGTRLDIPSRPAQALLAYLLLPPGKPHRRERLAGLLWPEVPEANAQKSLRQALWQLGRVLGGEEGRLVVADRVNVWVDVRGLHWVDVEVLQSALPDDAPVEDLAARVGVYAGELLPGFYEDWVVVERERLEALFDRQMTHLLTRLEAEQRWPLALEWGQRWIGLGHVPEAAYQTVMRAHAALGNGAGASLAYQRCREALRERLGLEPSELTRALHNQIVQAFGMNGLAPDKADERAAASHAPAEVGGSPASPYKGLHYFNEDDAPLYFGRERLVGRLLDYLRKHSFMAVVGASGSGKSSLVRAGLVPALRGRVAWPDDVAPLPGCAQWPVHILTPGRSPLESLAHSLAGEAPTPARLAELAAELAGDRGGLHRLAAGGPTRLLVVDQFEELFTQCRDEAARRAFIANLVYAAAPQPGDAPRVYVVITLRADFYAHCASYADLRQVLESHQYYIGPMNASELRRAIEMPAQLAGLAFQSGLVELILRDVGEEPGALPLLSHALLETWRRRRGRQLVLSGYAEAGGVHGAIARTAQHVYQQHLPPDHQVLARRIFLRLTELGEGTEATRRRVGLSELRAYPGPVDVVLHKLAEARLIIIGEDSVEVAHEALIREWPTLQQWLAEDRDGLRLHRRLTEAAQAWLALDHDPAELYRGARLVQAREWALTRPEALNALEQAFLQAAEAQQEREAAEREAQSQRELETARQLAEAESRRAQQAARSARQLRWAVMGLLGSFVLAVVLAAGNFGLAEQQRAAVETSQANLARSEAQRLAVEADALLQAGADAQLVGLLAIRSLNLQYTPDADAVLGKALGMHYPALQLASHGSSLRDAAFSADGDLIATAANDGLVRLWSADTGALLGQFAAHEGPVTSVMFSSDGRWLLTGGEDDVARLWDVGSRKVIRELVGHQGKVQDVALSADGQWAVTAGTDNTVRVWSIKTGRQIGARLPVGTESVALSPDGQRVLTGDSSGLAQVWDWQAGRVVARLEGHTSRLIVVRFSPDGRLAVTGGVDKTARVWDLASGEPITVLADHGASVFGAAFSPDGQHVLTAGEDRTTRLWDVATGVELAQFRGHSATVTELAFAPHGRSFVTAGADGAALVWDLDAAHGPRRLAGHTGQIWGVAYSPDGRYLVTGSADKTARLWDVASGDEVRQFVGHTAEVFGMAYSADGRYVLTAGLDGTARLWEAATGLEVRQFVEGTGLHVSGVAFSPDGRFVATGGDSQMAKIWDAATGDLLRSLRGHTAGLNLVAYSPAGTVLATTSSDATARLWDPATGALLHELMGHKAFVVAVAFSPDGERVVTAGADKVARIWDVATGEEIRAVAGHSDTIWGVAFTPDGDYVVTASTDGTARVWDAATGAEVRRLVGHTAGLEAVAVSPDGRLIATASDDGTARLWDVEIDDVIKTLCARLLRDLTLEERQQYGVESEGATCK